MSVRIIHILFCYCFINSVHNVAYPKEDENIHDVYNNVQLGSGDVDTYHSLPTLSYTPNNYGITNLNLYKYLMSNPLQSPILPRPVPNGFLIGHGMAYTSPQYNHYIPTVAVLNQPYLNFGHGINQPLTPKVPIPLTPCSDLGKYTCVLWPLLIHSVPSTGYIEYAKFCCSGTNGQIDDSGYKKCCLVTGSSCASNPDKCCNNLICKNIGNPAAGVFVCADPWFSSLWPGNW